MITLRGKEYDFSFTDRNHFRRYAEAIKKADAAAQKKFSDATRLYEEQDVLAMMDEYCRLLEDGCRYYLDLIDDVLGNGTANDALGPKVDDIEQLVDLWFDFQEALDKDAERFGKKTMAQPYGQKGKRK